MLQLPTRFLSILLCSGLLVGSIVTVIGVSFHPPKGASVLIPYIISGWSFLVAIFIFFHPERDSFKKLRWEDQRSKRAFYTLNSGSELVFWVDKEGKIIDANDQLTKIMGYSLNELIGHSPSIFDRGWIEDQLPELWSELILDIPQKRESIYVTKDNWSFPAEQTLRYYHNFNIPCVCIFSRDITEQKRFSSELTRMRELFDWFIQGLPIGAFVRDQEGNFLYVNKKYQEWTPKARTGSNIVEVFGPEEGILIANEDRLTLEEGSQVFFREPKDPKTSHKYYEVNKFAIPVPGRMTWIGGIVTDISLRRQADKKLLENRAFLEAVINQSPVGIIILDGNTTNIKICNDGAKEILGLSKTDNLTGKTISFDGLIWEVLGSNHMPPPLEQNPLYKAFFHEMTANDKMYIRRSDGQERFVLINSGPIYDSTGNFIAAIVAFLDISELNETQQQLEELNRNLEMIVEDRTKELLETNETLHVTIDNLKQAQDQLIESEKLASLGNLVAGVAHEINTPVGVAVTASSFLKEKTQELIQLYTSQQMRRSDLENYTQSAQESSSIILSNLERASELIKSFKMISVDQTTDQRRVFKIKEYLEELFLSLHTPDKKLKIQREIQGDKDLSITSYPGAIAQIVTNLFMNSCIHGFDGKTEGIIKISFYTSDERLILTYYDNGCGMDAETLKKIYDPFFTTKRNQGGTGLGMNIVFNIVNHKLGGIIKANSAPQMGTTFILDLPLLPPEDPNDPGSILKE